MPLLAAAKTEIMRQHARTKTDTGSPEVQIALLSARINYLTDHLKAHPHDFHTKYGLTKLVSKRRRLLTYLKRTNAPAYRKLLEQLDMRG